MIVIGCAGFGTSAISNKIMKTYKVFEKNGVKITVKQGWSWSAFFWTCIWAFTKKLTVAGIIGLVLTAISIPFGGIPYLIIGAVFGAKGNNWREAQLLKNGYTVLKTVQAENQKQVMQVAQSAM